MRRRTFSATCRDVALASLALAAVDLPASPASAQEPRPTPQQQTAPATEPTGRPGLFNEIGKLLKTPADMLPALPSFSNPDAASTPEAAPKPDATLKPETQIKSTASPPPPAAPAASPPAPAPAQTRSLPGVVSGRETCPRTPNGSYDCDAGSKKLCESKGYKEGRSLNTDSAFTCSIKSARAEGRKPCGTEYFVTSAFCQ